METAHPPLDPLHSADDHASDRYDLLPLEVPVKLVSILGVLVVNAFIAIRTTVLLRRGAIQPALAMWVFFTIAVAGSLSTYLMDGGFGLTDNILNSADLILCSYVAVAILMFGDRSTRFSRFDLGCLAAVVAILVFWAFMRQHASTNLLIQAILVISYAPVVHRLWTSDVNTESFAVWAALLLAPIFSLLSSKGTLATVYAVRAIACTGGLMILMARAELRGRRSRQPDPE